MAKSEKSDRSDPKVNKSLSIRMMLKKMPGAKASEIVAAVKKEYGHQVAQNMVYMVKTKGTMATNRKSTKGPKGSPMTSAALWIEAIKIARQLLQVTGSVDNATALLRAIEK
jgi:hypothetical protein